jgi:hypothetical protein
MFGAGKTLTLEADMTDPLHLATHYIMLWNETDADRRRVLLAQDWAPDATYADPLVQRTGHAEIAELIGAVQERFSGCRFALEGQVDGHGDHLRFSWRLGPQDGEAIVKGTDFAVTDGRRFKAVTGFLDQVPSAT